MKKSAFVFLALMIAMTAFGKSLSAFAQVTGSEDDAEYYIEDINGDANTNTFATWIEGATSVKVVNKKAIIKNWDGAQVATATVSVKDENNLTIKSSSPLTTGDYTITLAAGSLKIDGETYEEALTCILAVGEKSDLAEDALVALYNETEKASEKIYTLVYGVNIFQYPPAVRDQISEAIEDAQHLGEVLVEEQHIYEVIGSFRTQIKSLRPTLPKVGQHYIIKHKTSDKYLSMANGVALVTDAAKATPVQFHLTGYPSVFDLDMTSYIYCISEGKYLGYKSNQVSLVNNKNTDWGIFATHYNVWFIYNPQTRVCLKADKGGKKVTLEKSTVIGDIEGMAPNSEIDPVDNELCEWMIVSYDYPEVSGEETEKNHYAADDETTAIKSASLNAHESEIYNASGVRTSTLSEGVNIIKMSNGEVKKVIK